MPKKDKKHEPLEVTINQSLATLFADNLNMSVRGDGFVLLRFLAQLPEGLMEQGRFMVHQERLRVIIDFLCSQMDYYPAKAKPEKKKSRKKAAS